MKRIIAAIAVIASLALAPQAIANPNVTGAATQACQTDTGDIVLTATFSNAGFDEGTAVTVTDSQAGVLASGATSPFATNQTYPGPDRAAGTVTFVWSHNDQGGTIVAAYDAVTECAGPPPPPTTTTTTTIPPPPPPHHNGSPPPTGTPRQGTPDQPASHAPHKAPGKASARAATLPFSGLPLGRMALVAAALLGIGLAMYQYGCRQRYNEARRRRRPAG